MLLVATGHSEDIDAADAAREVIAQCADKLDGKKPQAGLLFCAVDFDYEIILAEINKAFPAIELIGCTTDGEISSAQGFLEDSITLTVFYSDTIEIVAGCGKNLSANITVAVADAIEMAQQKLSKEARFCIITPESLTANGVEVLEAVKKQKEINFPVFGGLAGDQWQMQKTFQFYNNEVLSDAIPVLMFGGPVYFSCGVKNGWSPIGNKKRVTKVSNNIVFELDGEPILDFYNHYLGEYNKISSEYALAVFEGNTDQFYLRSPAAGDAANKSIAFFGDVPEGATVQLSECTSAGIVDATKEAMDLAIDIYNHPKPPAAALIFSCATRKLLLGINTEKEISIAKERLPDQCAIAGFYTYGEIAPIAKNEPSRFHNSTFTVLLIGEA